MCQGLHFHQGHRKVQGVGLLCSSWPCAAYVSSVYPLLQAPCTPLAPQRKGETHIERSALSEAACSEHGGRGAVTLLRHYASQHTLSSPERNLLMLLPLLLLCRSDARSDTFLALAVAALCPAGQAACPGQDAHCLVLPRSGAEGRLQQAPQRLFCTQASAREKCGVMPQSYVFYSF